MGLWSRSGLFGGIGRRDRHQDRGGARGRRPDRLRAAPDRRPCRAGRCSARCSRACSCRTRRVILLDEPFTAIDAKTTADLLDLVRRWHGEARTVVAVLHDLDMVRRVFPQTLLIAREPVAWGATAEVLSAENLLKARHMVEAYDPHARCLPPPAPRKTRLVLMLRTTCRSASAPSPNSSSCGARSSA